MDMRSKAGLHARDLNINSLVAELHLSVISV